MQIPSLGFHSQNFTETALTELSTSEFGRVVLQLPGYWDICLLTLSMWTGVSDQVTYSGYHFNSATYKEGLLSKERGFP